MPKNRIRRILKLAILVAFLSGCSERFTAYYPTYGDAQRRGAIQSGWIPEALPKTATEIFEQHDIDSNEVWIRFSVPSDEKEKITAGLRKLSQDETLKIKLRYPSKAKWWFEGLIQQSPANDNALNADIYIIRQAEGKTAYLAVDRVSTRLYYWNVYEKA